MQYRTNPAFTLIELLIVIAIIGTLAAVAVVALTGQTSKADDATLKANLRSAVTVISGKVTDNPADVCDNSAVENIMNQVFSKGFKPSGGSYIRTTHAWDMPVSNTNANTYFIAENPTGTMANTAPLVSGANEIPYGCASDSDGWALWGQLSKGKLFCIDSYGSAGDTAVSAGDIPEILTDIDTAKCAAGTGGIGS